MLNRGRPDTSKALNRECNGSCTQGAITHCTRVKDQRSSSRKGRRKFFVCDEARFTRTGLALEHSGVRAYWRHPTPSQLRTNFGYLSQAMAHKAKIWKRLKGRDMRTAGKGLQYVIFNLKWIWKFFKKSGREYDLLDERDNTVGNVTARVASQFKPHGLEDDENLLVRDLNAELFGREYVTINCCES